MVCSLSSQTVAAVGATLNAHACMSCGCQASVCRGAGVCHSKLALLACVVLVTAGLLLLLLLTFTGHLDCLRTSIQGACLAALPCMCRRLPVTRHLSEYRIALTAHGSNSYSCVDTSAKYFVYARCICCRLLLMDSVQRYSQPVWGCCTHHSTSTLALCL